MNANIFDPVKPVAETRFGRLRGVRYGDVNIFMGIRYAAAKRFRMPEEQEAWEGVRNAYTYGPISPQMLPPSPPAYYRGLHMLQKQSEDCLNLNIWSPGELTEKKPVFVWMHGGGFFAGNALEEYSFDGFNLAKYGNIVFVSVNHRLNILGHLNLADYGEEYAHSVNAGIADLVAALKWIHENIEAFGGDPENVTICGHSGGGGKVQCMFQIEEAAPYFSRGIVLSGSMSGEMVDTQENSRRSAELILRELGIGKDNIRRIGDVSYAELVEAYRKALHSPEADEVSTHWSPVRDDYFRGFPLESGFMPWSKDKPMIFGSTIGEFLTDRLSTEDKEAMDEEARIAYLRGKYGEDAGRLMELFREAYPDHDILDLAYLDTMVRIPTMDTAKLHAKNGCHNTWIYVAAYNAPEDDRIPLWHGGDVCYIFRNEDRVYVLNEAVYGQRFSEIFSNLTLQFVRTGDPNTSFLPAWLPVSEEHPYTMVIDRKCELKEGYDDELTRLLSAKADHFAMDFGKILK